MFNASFTLCLLALLCLGAVQSDNPFKSDAEDAQCVGDKTPMKPVGTSFLDRFIRNWSKKPLTKVVIRVIKNRLKDPNSKLSKLMKSAAADPMTWDDSKEFNLEIPEKPTPMYVAKFLARVVGSTRTVFSYLWNYGYIAKVMKLSKRGADNFEGSVPPCALTNAIREFQLFNQIEPHDGRLSKETIKKMAEDRCGNGDVQCDTPECLTEDRYNYGPDRLRKKRYAVSKKKWMKSTDGTATLGYYFEKDYLYNPNAEGKTGHDKSMSWNITKEEVEKGFAEWTKYAPINFVEVPNQEDSDISIRFGSGVHGEMNPKHGFDGPYGVLAHMFYPLKGALHFDEAENYTAAHRGGINLHFVSAHEMGHGLGIKHSKDPRALMAPYYIGYREKMLAPDDINAIRDRYGKGVGLVAPLDTDPTVHKECAEVNRKLKFGDKELILPDERADEECITLNKDTATHHCIEEFTAGFMDPDKRYMYLLYNDNNYLKVKRGSNRFPVVMEPETTYAEQLVSNLFPGLEGPYDGAVTDEDDRITYLFIDGTVTTWDWSNNQIGDYDRTPIQNTIFNGLPNEIDAVAKHYDQYIFFSNAKYYIFTKDDGVLDKDGHPASLDGEQIASAFHSFFNGYVYTITDGEDKRHVYNLVRARVILNGGQGVNSDKEFQNSIVNSFGGVNIQEDTMFGWPKELGFCGTDLSDVRPDVAGNLQWLGR